MYEGNSVRIGRTEADEQKAVIQWCILMEKRWPELEYIYHVPNGGSRNRIEAANLKEEGVKAGVPDLELPAARGRYTGLHIELKHGNNKVTADQDRFLKALRKMGRCAVVCYEAEPAIQVISEYMRLSPGQHLSCDVLSEYPILK